MKKAILAAVLLGALANIAGAQTVDTKFAALTIWYGQLSGIADKWNETFMGPNATESPTSEQAQNVRAILDEQMKFFVQCALTYKVEGDTCDAQLRFKAVSHEIAVANWQLKYGMRALPPNVMAEASAKSQAIKAEGDKLKKEVEKCFGDEGIRF